MAASVVQEASVKEGKDRELEPYEKVMEHTKATINAPYLLFGSLHLQKTESVASVVQVSPSMKEEEDQKADLYQERKKGEDQKVDVYQEEMEHIKVCHT